MKFISKHFIWLWVRIFYLVRPRAWVVGVTDPFNRVVIYYPTNMKPPRSLENHENRHLEQVEFYGSWRFLTFYLLSMILCLGYKHSPFEVDARNSERRMSEPFRGVKWWRRVRSTK